MNTTRDSERRVLWPAIALFTVTVAYRLLLATRLGQSEWIPNFSPLTSLALCAPLLVPGVATVVLPLVILFASDLVLNMMYDAPLVSGFMVPRYAALAAIACLGLWLHSRRTVRNTFLAALASSVGFYVVTNTGAWLFEPGYAKSIAGWVQALTIGLPGLPPSWVFFRNSLLSDLAFTGLFSVCVLLPARRRLASAPAIATRDTGSPAIR